MTKERLRQWNAGTLRGADLMPEEHAFLLALFKAKLTEAASTLAKMPRPQIPFVPERRARRHTPRH